MNWPLHSIGDFCLTGSGGTPSRGKLEYFDGNIPWIKSGDLRENIVEIANEFITEDAVKNSSAKIVPKGAILVAMYGATVGRMAILGIDAATNQAVCNVIPNEKVAFKKYVYYALLSKVPEFLQNAVGGAQPNISQGMIRDTKIPFPPLEEQKRIAAILDKADAICRKRQQAIKLADEFLRSVFLNMFGDAMTNPKGWDVKPIVEVAPFYPLRNVSVTGDEKVWLLNLDQVESNSGQVISKYICEYIQVGDSTSWFDQSHVLYCKLRPYLNKVVMPDSSGLATSELIPLRPNPIYLNREYLTMYLRSESFVTWATNKVAGAKMPRLSTSELREHEITLPPMNLQNKFSSIYHKIAEIKKKYEMATLACDDGFASLSQKAFSGDL